MEKEVRNFVVEELPSVFSITFNERLNNDIPEVQVLFNDKNQIGDVINDNSYENDFYRYHDIFHYTFATMLGWSPCMRAMLKRKRKSNPVIDMIEDGARATITEEAISLILFNEAKRSDFFVSSTEVDKNILRIVRNMTSSFEVKNKTEEEWEVAILKGYEIFRKLIANNGGKVQFNANSKSVEYSSLT